jgi:hypothetical protein
MRCLAFIANKRKKLDANRSKAKGFLLPAVGAHRVAREAGDFADVFFGLGRHDDAVVALATTLVYVLVLASIGFAA